ncbi:alpha/beta hydrolase [Elongatibacter sediminis]|uniref:Alpha/beta hydrolase n=1 Tax=Elongatibacter sediminis TaxID=3119006 RepID=A0AAW9RC53_9GAMM
MKFDPAKIDPELRAGLANQPQGLDKLTRDTVMQVRAERARMFQPVSTPAVSTTEHQVPTQSGSVRVIVYRPSAQATSDTPAPGVLWVHGGGYVLGTAEDDRALKIAQQIDAVVVSVDYRLAPENPFPAGVEDCHASLLWMVDEALALGIDPQRIAIAGQSGGGGMAAGLALLNRDRSGPALALQLLLYPMIDNLHDTASGSIEDHPVWNRKTSLDAWEMYLNGAPGTAASPYAAAARAQDLTGLPPACICVGAEDLFRDECIDYARRLMAAGVAVELAVFPGLYHGGDLFVPEAKISQRLQRSFLRSLADALD